MIIKGSGFGKRPRKTNAKLYGVTIEHGDQVLNSKVKSWKDNRIKIYCPDAVIGDIVTVNALLGSDSAEISKKEEMTDQTTESIYLHGDQEHDFGKRPLEDK